MKKSYPCVRVQQNSNSKELLIFSASAIDIDSWVGIPQRLTLSGAETAGFQRTVSRRREQALRKFFSEPNNVIQNPLLCAIRQSPGVQVTFEPSQTDPFLGHVVIEFEDYSQIRTPELFKAVRATLEQRVPCLATRPRPDDLVSALQSSQNLAPSDFLSDSDLLSDEEDTNGELEKDDADESENEPAEEALFDESQISDFWDQLRARELLSEKIPEMAFADKVLGFSREMLESYLRPVILVDGQHRLTGALLAAEDQVDASPEATELVLNGSSAKDVRAQLLAKVAKQLPISLLMNESPAEHVFQYVVVNQKATPVPKALLGTIISTSLAAGELESVAERLEDAKIPLEGSRIVSILSRVFDSPFAGLVAKGMEDEGAGKLQWSVLGSLADIFRYLENGRFYHESSDHAKTWRNHMLDKSKIVAEWHAKGYESAYAYWQDLNGPWMTVFKIFWTRTKEVLATEDNKAKNFWGDPRDSNIFNKPSLHILTADFFCFLRERKASIDTFEDVSTLVDDWLEYASPQYFARDWKLAGVKKDSVGTRKQWSKLWAFHRREGGNPPTPAAFSQLYKA